MRKLKIILKLLSVLLLLITSSCKDYLDVVPDNVATLDYAFRMRSEAKKYLYTCYSFLPDPTGKGNPALIGDEMWKDPVDNASNFLLALGQQNVNSPLNDYWNGRNQGKSLWTAISQCNIFLENINKVPDLERYEREQWIAEVKALKAYYHFYLLRMYGPIPIMRENIPIFESVDDVRVSQEPIDSVFNYIIELLEEAEEGLPLQVEDINSELGRLTLPIALALKAKIMVYAASPLFNGNTDYSGFKNDKSIGLFNQEFDSKKWEAAADACKTAIDLLESLGYELYTFSPDAGKPSVGNVLQNQMNYRSAFNTQWNSEVIWANTNALTLDLQKATAPRQLIPGDYNRDAHGGTGATMNIAAKFYTENGLPIDKDITWDYSKQFNLKSGGENEKYSIKKGYTTASFNFNREPRFYASLGFDGGIWYGNGEFNEDNAYHLEAKAGQFLSNFDKGWYSVTGYWVKKYLNYTAAYTNANTLQTNNYPWVMMRMADLYLLYAEALNEAYGPGEEAFEYLNAIRQRVGLPIVQDSWDNFSNTPGKYNSKEGLREIIHRERTIELAFEGQRFWDVRRWKTAPVELNTAITGWDIFQQESENYYRQRTIFNQKFSLRNYFWPIRERDLIVNNNLIQNPGW